MKRNLVLIFAFLIVFAVGWSAASAQITIKLPKIKIQKPDKEQPKTKETTTTKQVKTKTLSSENIFK